MVGHALRRRMVVAWSIAGAAILSGGTIVAGQAPGFVKDWWASREAQVARANVPPDVTLSVALEQVGKQGHASRAEGGSGTRGTTANPMIAVQATLKMHNTSKQRVRMAGAWFNVTGVNTAAHHSLPHISEDDE